MLDQSPNEDVDNDQNQNKYTAVFSPKEGDGEGDEQDKKRRGW